MKSIPYSICLAEPEHIDALARIERSADTLYPKGYIPFELRGQTLPKPILSKSLTEGLLFCAVNTSNTSDPIGFASCQISDHYLHLNQLSVLPDYTQQGIGTKLLEQVLLCSSELNMLGVTLSTFSDLAWNAPFYEKLGFVILNENEQPKWLKDIIWEEQFLGLKNRVAMLALCNSAL